MAGKLRVVRIRVASPPPVSVRTPLKVSGVKPEARGQNTSRGAPQCDICPGRVREGNWLHIRGCPNTVVQYKRYDPSIAWTCPYGCPGVSLAEVRTHHWQCQFWADHGLSHPLE